MKFFVLLKHDLRNLYTSPGNVGMFLIFPTILILLMGFLFENMYTSEMVSSYDFYGVTMFMFITMMGATVPANAFLEKTIKEGNTRIFYTPVSRPMIYMSKILACFIFMGVLLTINILFLNGIGLVNFGGSNIFLIILMTLMFLLFLIMLGSAICVSIKSEEITNTILSNTTAVFSLFSGAFFPIASLGVWVDKVSNISPLKWILNSTFEMIYDGSSPNYWFIILGLIVLSSILLLIVHKNYKPEDYI